MTRLIELHPVNPQPRVLAKLVENLQQGGLVVCPTDAAYALICLSGDKRPLERLIRIRQLDHKHLFTLMCRDFSQISDYARIENSQFRILKNLLPGPYTCILPATRLTPKRLLTKRATLGIRMPQQVICQALLNLLDAPLLISTLILPDEVEPLTEPYEIAERLNNQVDLVIDGGTGSLQLTTVLDFSSDQLQLLRSGLGSIDALRLV